MSFRKLLEKSSERITSNWHIVVLDNETELATNMKFIEDMQVQITYSSDSKAHVLKLKSGNIISQIEDNLGFKLKVDKALAKFIALYPCS